MTQSRRWIPTLCLLPTLYLFGWLTIYPFSLLLPKLEKNDLQLIGTAITFLSFLVILPSWIKSRWEDSQPWIRLGLIPVKHSGHFKGFFRGFSFSLLLISVVILSIIINGSAIWEGKWNDLNLLDTFFLFFVTGFVEELLFRGWLWEELNLLLGNRKGILFQALIFSLSHIFAALNLKLTFVEALVFLIGLFFLGLLLALRRYLDNGSLWGCIGLHGGLAGIWLALHPALLNIETHAPWWLIGSKSFIPRNPIGGLIAVLSLILILFFQRTAFAKAGLPSTGARNDSSRGAIP